MKVTIMGSGVYGKALAKLLESNNNEITVWTEKEDLTNIIVPSSFHLTNKFEEAAKNADLIFIVSGSRFVESICNGLKPYIKDNQIFVLGSKGILNDGELVNEVFERVLPSAKYAVISGPTFAVDIAALEPLGFTIASNDINNYKVIKEALKSIKLEYSSDVIGTELCGSLKNAYAIGSGILGGFNYGPSLRSLYLTLVINEMKSIFKQMNAKEKTSLTLAGIGDLILTCTSFNSRNYTFGSLFALNNKEETKKYLETTTVEGYDNLKVFTKLFQEKSIDAPILLMVNCIVNESVPANKLIDKLLED